MSQSEFYPLHGGQLRQIAERFGIARAQLLDFSANINPEGPPPAVIPTLHASLEDPASLICYPDLEQKELKQSLARYASVNPDNIVVANGFVPLLDAALRALKIRQCFLPVPAFVAGGGDGVDLLQEARGRGGDEPLGSLEIERARGRGAPTWWRRAP